MTMGLPRARSDERGRNETDIIASFMSITAGTRIGPYEVTSQLGQGGMGVVFRARDTRLQRDVALKLLPSHLAEDPERLARLQREAQVLASLNLRTSQATLRLKSESFFV